MCWSFILNANKKKTRTVLIKQALFEPFDTLNTKIVPNFSILIPEKLEGQNNASSRGHYYNIYLFF